MMNVDAVLASLGTGRFQVIYLLVITIVGFFPTSWHMVSILWIGPKVPHHCRIPDNSSIEAWIPLSADGIPDSCLMYANPEFRNQTVPCVDGWVYEEEDSGPSIVSKWNMVCEKKSYVQLSQTCLAVGVTVGAVPFSILSDRYGRKSVLVLCSLLLSLIGALIVVAPQLELFYFLRFIIGNLQQGMYLAAMVMTCEMFSSQQRTFTGVFSTLMWGLGMSLIPLIAYVAHSWVYYQLFISLYGFLWLPLYWWLPETLPYLHANNKVKAVEELVKQVAKMNRVPIPLSTLVEENDCKKGYEKQNELNGKIGKEKNKVDANEINHCVNLGYFKDDEDDQKVQKIELETLEKQMRVCELKSEKIVTFNGHLEGYSPDAKTKAGIGKSINTLLKKYSWKIKHSDSQASVSNSDGQLSIWLLFTNRMMLTNLFMCSFIGFIINVTFYGMTLTSDSLFGNRFVNGFLDAIILIPSTLSVIFCLGRFGRLKPYSAYILIAAITLTGRMVIQLTAKDNNVASNIDTFLGIAGKFGISGAMGIFQLVTVELFPTTLRSQALGISTCVSKIGNIIASYSSLLLDSQPVVFFGLLAGLLFLVCMMTHIFPETHGKALPESIEDIERLYRKKAVDIERSPVE